LQINQSPTLSKDNLNLIKHEAEAFEGLENVRQRKLNEL
jgi:hypothetical protein